MVRERTGADLVLCFAPQLRQTVGTAPGYQPPAGDVHVDYWPARAEPMTRAMLAASGMGDFRFRRVMAINLWRVLSPPPQDYPLALCDGRTVGDDEGVRNLMIRVDTLPEPDAIPAEEPDDPALPSASVFPYSAAHEWYYFSDMTPDELLLFKLYDSDRSGTWRVPHTAFHDTSRPNTVPRASIEYRTLAYFA